MTLKVFYFLFKKLYRDSNKVYPTCPHLVNIDTLVLVVKSRCRVLKAENTPLPPPLSFSRPKY